MGKLDNKLAVVTGGGSGIGRAITEKFAAEGALVALLDFNEEQGTETVDAIKAEGGKAQFYKCDVSDSAGIASTFDSIKSEHGNVDVLVNNAGIAAVGNLETCTEEELDRIYNVNVKGVFNCLKSGIPQMLENGGGSIINLASIASSIGIPDRFAYSMSKGAAYTMTLSVATDYVDQGIRCNSISPARVHTPFVDGFIAKNYPGQEEEVFKKLSATQPIGRMGQPEEIANMALFLASDDAAFITATDFPVDGGFIKIKK
ncbi:short chain dehydrogenase [Lentisphaera araneosa HTCC2155]|uniref:Short chain dehydrogenase n=1 Tax=Lentisphaera araneosa HTCC2155 TaxID=313628 RepID=A6DG03_9BACT|nr:SDR family oxidoreductase [Lentisphaera araneosa]EDM29733.1 short chain dehydrogenase [Lentisphaera araneosa HTCC2155]